ncbi:MOSC domain-containing protein [Nonomuraea roseoviolacea]|uniref:Uncharacterized protein YcbX n=1 Tax=Nonomuraea roseoviolacea subsp. carminata TaxID=160689 RepID=A0ABT1JU71_9ACTN|nr:MOSC N-terminal beta barrel domain-containing protein [Nonomuraea roseoviolacea]MCP2345287.1 uncharacterized protein YcbX [Nonomuraea roseoviolacea subsp. carminata]
MSELLGTVGRLRRYPVKSMLGEDLDAAELGERGLRGDRRRAVLDVATGRIASAKSPRLWRALLTLDGTRPPGDAELSALLGRRVRLVESPPEGAELERSVPEEVLERGVEAEVGHTVGRLGGAAPGTFLDFAPVHLIAASTLARIGALGPRGTVEADRYRPNLVIEPAPDGPGAAALGGPGAAGLGGPGAAGLGGPVASDGSVAAALGGSVALDGSGAAVPGGFVENGWVGAELLVGDEVVLAVIAPTPRCAVPTLAHGVLPRDVDALRVPARHNQVSALGMAPQPCAGAYARVLRPGRVAKGDPVRLRVP